MYTSVKRKLYGSTSWGVLKDTVILKNDDEQVVTYWLVLNQKIRMGVGICETYWYHESKEHRIYFRFDKDGLIIGRFNITLGKKKKRKQGGKVGGKTKDTVQV